MTESVASEEWVPSACTLPTAAQPLRRGEFDALFARDVLAVHRDPGQIRFDLRPDPETAARAAGLAAKETACCSFFTFALTMTDGWVGLTVSAAPGHADVLAALGARAESRIGSGR